METNETCPHNDTIERSYWRDNRVVDVALLSSKVESDWATIASSIFLVRYEESRSCHRLAEHSSIR